MVPFSATGRRSVPDLVGGESAQQVVALSRPSIVFERWLDSEELSVHGFGRGGESNSVLSTQRN